MATDRRRLGTAGAAVEIVRQDDRWSRYRAGSDDAGRMAKYDKLRAKFFLPVRPLRNPCLQPEMS